MTEADKEIINSLKRNLEKINYNLAHNTIYHSFPYPLEKIAINNLALQQWQHDDIWEAIVNYKGLWGDIDENGMSSDDSDDMNKEFNIRHIELKKSEWTFIEDVVLKKVSTLQMSKYYIIELRERVKFVGRQILSNFLPFFCYLTKFDRMKKNYHFQIYWTQNCTIDKVLTAEALIENTDLSTVVKYIIACNNCLNKKVVALHNQLPEDFIDEFVNKNQYRLVTFWTYYTRGKLVKLINVLEVDNGIYGFALSVSSISYMFDWTFKYENEVSLQYFWVNLLDKQVKDSVVKYTQLYWRNKELKSMDIFCYLMSQMNEVEIVRLFLEEPFPINVWEVLGKLVKDNIWRDVFLPTAKKALQFIKTMDIKEAMEILFCWEENLFEEGQLKTLVSGFTNRQDFNYHNSDLLSYFDLVFQRPIEVWKEFFRKMSEEDKVRYMYSSGLFCLDYYLSCGLVEFAETVIKEMLTNEEERNKYIQSYVESHGVEVVRCLIIEDNYEQLDAFVMIFLPEEERSKFKNMLATKFGKHIISHMPVQKKYQGDDMDPCINKFLNWAFEGEEKAIFDLKVGRLSDAVNNCLLYDIPYIDDI